MRIIIGLGNPESEYNNTRHNVGFMYLNYIFGDKFKLNKRFNALEYITNIDEEKIIVIKPLSYMNLSGEVVKKYMDFYKLDISNILVVQDDLDMEIGKYKLLYNRGDGGHNGIKNISNNVGSKAYLRLKIGISKSNLADTKDYVLGKLTKKEKDILNITFSELSEFIDDYIHMDIDRLMGKYNTKSV